MSFVTTIGVWPWLQNKVVDPMIQVIRRGAEPKQLAFSAALGVTLGIFPICGTTVILCGVAIAMLGTHCNAVTVMVLNFAVTPLELSLIIPFLRLGEVITGGQHFPLTSDAFKKVITGHASKDVMLSIVHAMLGWLIAAPFVLAALYMVSIPCFKLLIDKSIMELCFNTLRTRAAAAFTAPKPKRIRVPPVLASKVKASAGCKTCRGKGAIECPGCKGTGRNKKNGNIFERWKCFDCQGFGLKSCPGCGKGGLTPEQRGER
ncbi:hypothetical protein GUJ93_ZPchr0005g15602 [Zizania palustris]|uniref:DUF2062 domain-containing protein n=1 Tax=Zizania palustris TaxID=103762 RepID=A0A8J5SQ82_ZIZPA|nr:hypothetical protein GUJ93_ZPchr0005g15602 [Zizania palustris]